MIGGKYNSCTATSSEAIRGDTGEHYGYYFYHRHGGVDIR